MWRYLHSPLQLLIHESLYEERNPRKAREHFAHDLRGGHPRSRQAVQTQQTQYHGC